MKNKPSNSTMVALAYNSKIREQNKQKMEKIEKIKSLYAQIPEKTKFISELAIKLHKSPGGIRNNWFSGFWSIPKKYQDRVIEALEEKKYKL